MRLDALDVGVALDPLVLIIHHDREAARELKLAIEEIVRRVVIAIGGPEGLAAARSERPDLIVCAAPGLNPHEILRQLACDADLATVPFIILSPDANANAQLAALRLGASEYLVEPVDTTVLKARLVHELESADGGGATALQGRLELLGCGAILEALDASRSSGVLHLSAGGIRGRIVIDNGTVVGARAGLKRGEDAAFTFIWAPKGAFAFEPLESIASRARDGVELPVRVLLMDAAVIHDELAELGGAPEPSDVIRIARPEDAADLLPESARWAEICRTRQELSVSEIASRVEQGVFRCRAMAARGVRAGALSVLAPYEPDRTPLIDAESLEVMEELASFEEGIATSVDGGHTSTAHCA
jgi:CheY-like chemotaxis protein